MKLQICFSDSIIVSSEHAKSRLTAMIGKPLLDRQQVLVWRFRVDVGIGQVIPNPKILSKNYGLDAGSFILCPMQLTAHKNHLDVLLAYSKCTPEFRQDVKLVFTGGGYVKSNSIFRRLFFEVQAKELVNDIYFLGKVDELELHSLMKYCLAIISASSYEGWNTVIEEARCLQVKNLIVSSIPLHLEQLKGTTALFFPLGDISKLSKLISSLHNTNFSQEVDYSTLKSTADAELKNFILSYLV